jgi:ligand-binding sensor domain-containing protein/DNA-binding CsgD family transcriptional regulator
MCRLFLLLLLMMACFSLQARSFSPVGSGRGLEAHVVRSLMVDSSGYLWVGAREGLFRYDGYETRVFLPDSGNRDAISDIDIRYVHESADGSIWIGSNAGGLDRFDPSTGRFTNFGHNSSNPDSIIRDSVNGIADGAYGSLWVATNQGLSRLDHQNNQIEHFRHDPESTSSLANDQALSLHLGHSGTLWIGTAGGVSRWNPLSRDFTSFDLAALTTGGSDRNHVFALHEDQEGALWCGTKGGLIRLIPQSGTAHYIDLGEQDGYSPVITSVESDHPDRLWLTTMSRGLLMVDRETGAWHSVSSEFLDAGGDFPQDALTSVAFGAGQVFVGSWGSGVYRTASMDVDFRLLSMNNTVGLTNNVISAVMAADGANGGDSHAWLGSYGGGPQLLDVVNRAIRAKPIRRHQMRESGVMSLAGPLDGRLYAGTTHGLYEFSSDGSQIALYEHDPETEMGIGEGYVTALLAAEGPGLWIGMGGSGLYYFETASQTFTSYRHQPGQDESISGDFVTALLGEKGRHVWVGTQLSGLNRCRIESWFCQRFSSKEGLKNSLSHHHVTALYRDRQGRIWVATDGGGLNQVIEDESGGIIGFRHWKEENGLLNDGIKAIEEDLDGSLWLSSRDGLSRLDPASGKISNFAAASGLSVSHFNRNSSASDGANIYFGSTEGLLVLPTGMLFDVKTSPVVQITSVGLTQSGENIAVEELPGGLLRLPHKIDFSIELAVLDFAESPHRYAYRLEESQSWTELGPQRQVMFHGLAPGNYEFQGRARDVYGLWGETQALSLEIVPPFWMTLWFRGLMIALLLLAALIAHLSRQATLSRRADEMLRLGVKREQALEEKLGSEAELAVLTPRQKEILQLIAEGNSTREIAELLGVSIKTVEAHRSNLMERLEIFDVPGLVRLAIRSRLVSA